MEVITWILMNYQTVIASVVAVLGGIITVAMLIPGEQPEAALQKVVDFIKKWSK